MTDLGGLIQNLAANPPAGWKRDVHRDFRRLRDPFTGAMVDIDRPLLRLVKVMWERRIRTTASCQNMLDCLAVYRPAVLPAAQAAVGHRSALIEFVAASAWEVALVERWRSAGALMFVDGQHAEAWFPLAEVPALVAVVASLA